MLIFNHRKFALEHLEDCSIVFNTETKDIFLLNTTGSFIFKKLQEQKNIQDIIEEYILENKDVEYNAVCEDFISMANELIERGIFYND